MATKDCEERPSEGSAPLDALEWAWRTAGPPPRGCDKETSGGRLVGTSEGNRGTSGGAESRAAALEGELAVGELAEGGFECGGFGAALSSVGTLRRCGGALSLSASVDAAAGDAAAGGGVGVAGGEGGTLRLTFERELNDASPPTLMLGIATTALALATGVGSNAGLGLDGGGGRLDENAAGSGGAMKAGGGVESKRSLKASCVTGAFSSLSRREAPGTLRGVAGVGGGVGVNRGASVVTDAARLCSSPTKGASSAMGSISSVRSSPP